MLFLCLTFTTSQVFAVVSIDSPASSNGVFNGTTGVTSISWSHTVGTNISRVLYVNVSTATTTLPAFPSARVTSVTYGGTGLTLVGTRLSSDNRNSVEIYRLINPPSGTATVQVNLTLGAANYVLGGATSYSGVNQTTPNGTFTSAVGNDTFPTVTITDGVSGDVVLDTLATSPTAGFFFQGTGQTSQWLGRSYFGFAFDIGGGSTEFAASPVTMSWNTVSADNWVLAGIAIKTLGTTATSSMISGKIADMNGRPIPRTSITLRNLETGEEFYKTSNHFGFYNFNDLETGGLYQIQVAHGRYTFSSDTQILKITESFNELNFLGFPKETAKDQDFKKAIKR